MDDKKIENLFQDAARVSLTADEKSTGREMLRSYMSLTPMRTKAAKPARTGFFSGAGAYFGVHRAAAVSSITLAVTFSMVGVSFAAEGALPGDTLYPVKVSVNEEVRAALTPSQESKAKWEAERAERRLAEAEALAEKGELKAEARATVEAEFRKHAAKAQQRVAAIAERDDDDHVEAEITAHLEGSLDAHKRIIAAIVKERRGSGKDDDIEVATLASSVEAEANAMALSVIENTRKSDARAERTKERQKSATEARRDAAVRKIAEVRSYLAGLREKLGVEATVQAEARVAAAEAVIAEGNVSLEAEEYGEAIKSYAIAQRQAQEAKSLIRARGKLKVRVDLRGDDEQAEEGPEQEDTEEKSRLGR